MLLVFWLLLFLVGACLVLLMPALWGRGIYNHYRGSRAVICPENRQQVAVRFHALRAAVTGFGGKPNLRLAECTRWPQRADCEQDCIPEALRTSPYTQGEIGLPKTKRVYHIPVLLAASAAWLMGAIWHSQYLFRVRWMQSLALSRPAVHQMVWSWAPHLLSVATCFLFAYGVASLLAWRAQKGLWRGIITSIFLWGAIALASLAAAGLAGISRDLLRMETGYTFLASVAVGAIIGGLSGKLTEEAFEAK